MTTRRRIWLVALAMVATAGCRADRAAGGDGAAVTGSTASGSTVAVAPTAPVAPTTERTRTIDSTPSTTTASPPTTTDARTTDAATATTTTTTPTTTSVAPPPVTTGYPAPGSSGSIRDIRPPSDIPPPPIPADWIVETIGTSVQGRAIVSWSRRLDEPRRSVVVIGAVHGNEPASPPLVRALVDVAYPSDVEVWLVPELNPDGVAAGTRWNANGVDLNRNFPWDWRAVDGGPGPLSEPESRAAVDLIDELRPDLVVWVHQPYGYVSSVGPTDRMYEDAWSRGSGTPTRSGVTQHGGGETWTVLEASIPSMLIEMDTWAATPDMVAAHRAGFVELIASLP